MERIGSIVMTGVLLGALAGSARADEGVLVKEEVAENYCHIKFQALRPRTLASDRPEVKRSLGDIVDFYGPCDANPTSEDLVMQQRRDEQFRFGRDYEDGSD